MVKTNNAATGTTYRLRLYNATDDKVLDNYGEYPTLVTADNDYLRYSKNAVSSLPTNANDQTYYLDPKGYADVAVDDDSDRDMVTASQYPVMLFATPHNNDSDAIQVIWNGQSSVAPSTRAVYLQVFRYGSPDQWVTVASDNTTAADTDFSLTGSYNSSLSSYYDSNNITHWRVYQASGSEILRSDSYTINFSIPVPGVEQIHYRWRNDNGSQTTATWRESEDTGDPSAPTVAIDKNENIRLRFSFANTGGGSADNYRYRIEYATSTGVCAGISDWYAVATTTGTNGHWRVATSTQVTNGSATTKQMTDSEGYTFSAGQVVAYPSATTSAITLAENHYTEIEYVIRATTDAQTAGTYCFRASNDGADLEAYGRYPIITLSGDTNTAPYFTVDPKDGGSASTSPGEPTNYGNDVTFTATADDNEDGGYYLAVCKNNSITPGVDGPPTCVGGSWCVSDLTATSSEATCTHTAAEATELNNWYAFVCDKHAGFGIAKCSSGSQGSGSGGINDSPFAVNHPPVLTSVSTDSSHDPGGTFVINTVSSDTDTTGGNDTLTLYVCSTNSATVFGCTGETFCSAVAAASPNASCSFATSSPAAAGAWAYWAFVFDNHDTPAVANPRNSTYVINNVAPSLGALELNGGANIGLQIRPNQTVVQTVNTSVMDLNGCYDIDSAIARVYMSGVTGGYNCTANDNNCYQITTTNCVKSACDASDDTIATFTCTANLKYFAVPTDNSTGNPWEPYQWLSYLEVYDGANYVATTSPGVELSTSQALDVPENKIDFGAGFSPGDNTGTDNTVTTVINCGNSPIDTNLSGTNMVGYPTGVITVDNLKWDLSNFNWVTGTHVLTSSGANVDINAPKATTTLLSTEDEIMWGIGIPADADASTFTGKNTFTVILDNDGW